MIHRAAKVLTVSKTALDLTNIETVFGCLLSAPSLVSR